MADRFKIPGKTFFPALPWWIQPSASLTPSRIGFPAVVSGQKRLCGAGKRRSVSSVPSNTFTISQPRVCNVPGSVRHLLCFVRRRQERWKLATHSIPSAVQLPPLLSCPSHQTNKANTLSLTGLVATNSWLLATAVSEIIVTTELQTKEKNRFLCRVILWQLKLLEKRNKNKWVHGRTTMCTWGQLWHFEKLLILLTSLTSTLSSGPEQI